MNSKKLFWDLEEETGFVALNNNVDSLEYKVYNAGDSYQQQQIANLLGMIRLNVNILLIYLIQNPDLWYSKSIAWGIFHTFDIHVPNWRNEYSLIIKTDLNDLNQVKKMNDLIISDSVSIDNLFPIQEMTPNTHGIIGLNKPKKTKFVNNYEIADRRSFHLTLRNITIDNSGEVTKVGSTWSYDKIMDLVIHELTHTTCNDIHWKSDNHMPPYQAYHTLMRKWARECGIMN
jgi:hypothetical protein